MIKELDVTYNKALTGIDGSKVVTIFCDDCEQAFNLIKGKQYKVCEHLHNKLNGLH